MAAPSGSSETSLQSFIHTLEHGRLAGAIRWFLLGAVLLAIALVYLGWNFRGFAFPEAMDQAQVARQIATGHGWSTEFIRPLAIWQIRTNLGAAPKGDFPDTFNAPLPPLVNSVVFKLAGAKPVFGENETIVPVERFIVVLSMVMFLLSTVVQFFLLRRLFDQRLAMWAVTLTLINDLCWQFTLTGLPQMLMMLLFNLALYALTRAVEINVALETIAAGEARVGYQGRPPVARTAVLLLWLAGVGGLFGLLTLSHGLSAWFFLGLLIFAAFHFRRRGPVLLVLLAAFALVYTPWLVRTYRVSGSPFGVAGYAMYEGVSTSTATRMRSMDGPLTDGISPRFFRPKIEAGVVAGVDHLVANLGGNLVAIAFFIGLLHVFRRREVGAIRTAVLLMWAVGLVGMAGMRTAGAAITPDQLDVLFLPVMVGYGLAFLLVLFSRREGNAGAVARFVLFGVVLIISGTPLLLSALPHNQQSVQYPPYYEPAINRLGKWTRSNEIIASDMPWAVAWYADRKSLWIPLKLHDLMGLSDDNQLDGQLAGVFLTPVSRATPLMELLYRGPFQDWQALILGRVDIPLFPFHEQVLPMGDLSYSFLTDTKRWEKTGATAP